MTPAMYMCGLVVLLLVRVMLIVVAPPQHQREASVAQLDPTSMRNFGQEISAQLDPMHVRHGGATPAPTKSQTAALTMTPDVQNYPAVTPTAAAAAAIRGAGLQVSMVAPSPPPPLSSLSLSELPLAGRLVTAATVQRIRAAGAVTLGMFEICCCLYYFLCFNTAYQLV
jgi:hypothetical protein